MWGGCGAGEQDDVSSLSRAFDLGAPSGAKVLTWRTPCMYHGCVGAGQSEFPFPLRLVRARLAGRKVLTCFPGINDGRVGAAHREFPFPGAFDLGALISGAKMLSGASPLACTLDALEQPTVSSTPRPGSSLA
jgi:hypothetical protein